MSAHDAHRMHRNSLEAFEEEVREGSVSKRRELIFRSLMPDRVLTDRQVMEAVHFTDMDTVRPRITEMIQDGRLEELGKTVCPHTRKMVRLVTIPEFQRPPLPPPNPPEVQPMDIPLAGQLFAPTDADLVAELEREVGKRRVVYPRLVERGTMSPQEAEFRTSLMGLAARRLRELTLVMLVSTNITYGGYTVLAKGMTWVECYAVLAEVGAGAYIDRRGHMRQRGCKEEA